MALRIAEMSMADYDEVIAFWQGQKGVGLSDADARDSMAEYLKRNRGMSFVVRDRGQVVAAVLCGHDGRRGYLHHLAVAPSHRKRGIGKGLVERCLRRLAAAGIHKCNIFLFGGNARARRFWGAVGWRERADLRVMQRDTGIEQ